MWREHRHRYWTGVRQLVVAQDSVDVNRGNTEWGSIEHQ